MTDAPTAPVPSATVLLLRDGVHGGRQNRDFQRADQIRDELLSKGIVLEDSEGGTRWKKSG